MMTLNARWGNYPLIVPSEDHLGLVVFIGTGELFDRLPGVHSFLCFRVQNPWEFWPFLGKLHSLFNDAIMLFWSSIF